MYVFLSNEKYNKKAVSRSQQTELTEKHYSINHSELEDRCSFTTGVNSKLFFDFDDLLPEIGEFGVFQKLMFLFMIPFCFIAPFVYLSQIFMTLTPTDYYCFVPELSLIPSEEERKNLSIPMEGSTFSRCMMYERNYTEIYKSSKRSQYTVYNASIPKIKCQNGHVFAKNLGFHTASIEFQWVCDKERYATYAQMFFFLGSIIGCLGYGHYADNCGRLAALVSSCGLALFGSFLTSLCKSFSGFMIGRFIVGASYDTCFTMIYILGMTVEVFNCIRVFSFYISMLIRSSRVCRTLLSNFGG